MYPHKFIRVFILLTLLCKTGVSFVFTNNSKSVSFEHSRGHFVLLFIMLMLSDFFFSSIFNHKYEKMCFNSMILRMNMIKTEKCHGASTCV